MTRADLISRIAQKQKLDLRRAELIVEAVFDSLEAAFSRGERAEIRGFGTFSVRSYKGYLGRNPKTGAPTEVEPKRLPFFKPSKTFSGSLNEAVMKAAPSRA